MLSTETQIFLQLLKELAQRVLHPAIVTEVYNDTCTVEVEDRQLTIEPGQDLLIFYEIRNEFMKQSAHVDGVMRGDTQEGDADDAPTCDDEQPLLVGLTPNGDPVSAESRQCYRVSTLIAELVADLGSEKNCPLIDVSATGFAVISTQSCAAGTVINACLHFNGKQYSGTACVQSIKDVGNGRYRYGLHSIEDKSSSGNLLKGQQQIGMAIQREQLRRMRGTA